MTFKPTQDDLIDYHLKRVDPKLARQIESYLQFNPEDSKILEDFSIIEANFKKNFTPSVPSDLTLQRVRNLARRQIKPGFWSFLKLIPARQQVAWAAVICLAVGLTFLLRDISTPSNGLNGIQDHNKSQGVDNTAATLKTTPTEITTTPTIPEATLEKIKQDYAQAVSLYQQSQLPEACNLFGSIIAQNPAFEKRTELYSYWIDALNKLNDKEQANQKQEELKKILERQNAVNVSQ